MEVPHRKIVSYDWQSFAGFPQRLGFDEIQIITVLEDKDKIPLTENIVQEWFYFVTLHLLSDISQT